MIVKPFPTPKGDDELLTTGDLCDRWDCHISTIYRIPARELPYMKPAGKRLYKLDDVLEYEKETTVAA